jgi:NAD(P)H-dependent FMN reductase
MTTIIAVSGSLRRHSFNTALINAAADQFPDQITCASIEGIPLYNADVEKADGVPKLVSELKDQIAGADGLLISAPEYNNAIPGVLKNAIDWLSRPADDISRVFHDRPVAVMGASAGRFGTILSQNALLPVLRTLRTRPWYEGRLMVSSAGDLVDDEGVLSDEETLKRLKKFVEGFIEFCEK